MRDLDPDMQALITLQELNSLELMAETGLAIAPSLPVKCSERILFYVKLSEEVRNLMRTSAMNAGREGIHIPECVFLERGNAYAGLLHIALGHSDDFELSMENIPVFLKIIFTDHIPTEVQTNRRGFFLLYDVPERVGIAIGFNGFVVSAYPQ